MNLYYMIKTANLDVFVSSSGHTLWKVTADIYVAGSLIIQRRPQQVSVTS